ncbi:MAG: succinyl-diaminopimelate desuccinylase [Burkholderiales bacterium]|nr:succinyl-diaminopimelate desuccinylase [Burkholderiales bacterium]
MTHAPSPSSSGSPAAIDDESATLALLEQLISRRSLTPDDAGCQQLIADLLVPLGFECHHQPYGPAGATVDNLWAIRRFGAPGPTVVFAGHTDVVPTGPLAAWHSDPFVPTHRAGKIYGRGAADMKASIAAMLVAVQGLIAGGQGKRGAMAFLLTSDEEGPSIDGTVRVCEWLRERGEQLDACIVGEPTSVERLGDMIKNGRRGSLTGRLTVRGVQGHIAYPQLADNPIHRFAPALAELVATRWDEGNDHFQPTSWQVSNIHAGTGAGNVIPGELVVDFNFRYSTESTPEGLRERVEALLTRHGLQFELSWVLGGLPFLTRPGALIAAMSAAISAETGVTTELSTTGGTSDGRFIAQICPQVVEFGPINASIHKIDEHGAVADLAPLARIYRRTLAALLG